MMPVVDGGHQVRVTPTTQAPMPGPGVATFNKPGRH
jgi:hypothetical protein